MKMAAEYRAMADECFKWAREARADQVRVSLLQLAQVWLDAATKLDGLFLTQTKSAPDELSKTARSADRRSGDRDSHSQARQKSGLMIMLSVLVSAQRGGRHVFSSFSETFPQSGNCPFFGGDTRFSCERADEH